MCRHHPCDPSLQERQRVSPTSLQNGLLRPLNVLRAEPLGIQQTDFTIDRGGDLSWIEGQPRLLGIGIPHSGIGIEEDLVAHELAHCRFAAPAVQRRY